MQTRTRSIGSGIGRRRGGPWRVSGTLVGMRGPILCLCSSILPPMAPTWQIGRGFWEFDDIAENLDGSELAGFGQANRAQNTLSSNANPRGRLAAVSAAQQLDPWNHVSTERRPLTKFEAIYSREYVRASNA